MKAETQDLTVRQDFTRAIVRRFDLHTRHAIHKDLIAQSRLKQILDESAQGLIIEMETYLSCGQHIDEPVRSTVPAGWWQMFKRECFPIWLERWFPVVTEERKVVPNLNVYVCPHSDLPWKDRKHMEFMRVIK